MSFGYCYDPYDPGWGGKPQAGALALRQVTMQRVPVVGDLGILRDQARCSKRSAHCHGRAWDAKIAAVDIAVGDELAAFFVLPDVATALGIQRVIWGFGPTRPPKEWDSRPGQRFWSAYSGPHHDDHVHVELCWQAAKILTVQQVEAAFDSYWGAEEDFLANLTEEEQREILEGVRALAKVKEQLKFLYDAIKNGSEKAATTKQVKELHGKLVGP